MTERLYVVTAEFINVEQDGQDPQDGSPLQMAYKTRETWAFPATTPIGEIMDAVNEVSYASISVTITEDRVSAKKIRDEKSAAFRAKNPEFDH
ncbi:hypothetical protein N5C66_03695 [Rhizobium pusense]|uniref:Uncharacterized protein n=1 Tax=Agrobacterium genomosp. 2 str. CFBP 5494 TaxID=1183436 RepID=A0A9W5AXK3_9HYPH|nr:MULTISPECIES: hypothetical protein [Rhizobium/Agrobacterium group]MDH0908421.1 hypothetical protein [Agrobacterium pusense]MDH1094253.1 hypothetical protein [Agrobacterium pusense]MDH1110835.1 hypothetical protein [Agrobacterium pusense]MDH2192161.1 hypothetical protein [Agrobacterium pusense]CAD7043562.1 hypothetical protein RP007_01040 [Rhizobium sp. P007]